MTKNVQWSSYFAYNLAPYILVYMASNSLDMTAVIPLMELPLSRKNSSSNWPFLSLIMKGAKFEKFSLVVVAS